MPRKTAKSGLPKPVPGEAFSLLGTLRRCTRLLTVADVAEMLQCSQKTVYKHIDGGKIPVANVGIDMVRVDPKGWLHLLEHDNRHLLPSARVQRVA